MNRILLSAAIAAAMAAGSAAQSTVLIPGIFGVATSPFAAIAATQGTMLASTTVSGTAFTFAATVRAAVYRNTLGALDFYYQVARTGKGTIAGSKGNQMVEALTGSDFAGFWGDAYASDPDPDGVGFFTASNNAGVASTTFGRSADGAVVRADFGTNGLSGTETSATYVFRTNARAYTDGTFGVIDGSTFSGVAYSPLVVPEPQVWGLLIVGFGVVGVAARRRRMAVLS